MRRLPNPPKPIHPTRIIASQKEAPLPLTQRELVQGIEIKTTKHIVIESLIPESSESEALSFL